MTKAITTLLEEVRQGNPEAGNQLMPLIYERLHRIAAAHFANERPGHSLQPTELIHEVYLRLLKDGAGPWQNRAHFFATASRAMRRILVDHARKHLRDKHGGGLFRVDLDKAIVVAPEKSRMLVELDRALKRLEKRSERQSRVVELRYFGGLSVKETAEVLSVGLTTVKEDWALARAWLERELRQRV